MHRALVHGVVCLMAKPVLVALKGREACELEQKAQRALRWATLWVHASSLGRGTSSEAAVKPEDTFLTPTPPPRVLHVNLK